MLASDSVLSSQAISRFGIDILQWGVLSVFLESRSEAMKQESG